MITATEMELTNIYGKKVKAQVLASSGDPEKALQVGMVGAVYGGNPLDKSDLADYIKNATIQFQKKKE